MNYLASITVSILEGSLTTIQLFCLTLLFSVPIGVMISLARVSRRRFLSKSMEAYIWVMRGTPLLLQMFFIYFGLPNIGISIDRFAAAVLAFSLNYAAYFAEIFRGGILSIDKGQFEASYALGLNGWQTMRWIILPQVVRRVLPPISNEVITLVKDTSLVYAIGLSELLRAAKIAATRDFTISPFVVAALFYLFFTYLLTRGFHWLERRSNHS